MEGRLYFDLSFTGTVNHVGCLEYEGSSLPHRLTCEKAARDDRCSLAHLLLIQSGGPAHGMALLTFR